MLDSERFEKVEVTSAKELRDWLELHVAQEESIWLVKYKKHVKDKYVSTNEVLDELLCFGWIDGLLRKLDEEKTMQLISPRRVQHWGLSYKQRAQKLIEEGKMQKRGYEAIERSKSLGLWEYMSDVDQLEIPDELQARLNQEVGLLTMFEALAPSYRRNVLRWIKIAKTPETRTKRINLLAEATAKGEKIPQM